MALLRTTPAEPEMGLVEPELARHRSRSISPHQLRIALLRTTSAEPRTDRKKTAVGVPLRRCRSVGTSEGIALRRSNTRRRVSQHEFTFRRRGGPRAGSGRKPKGDRAGVPHTRRPDFASRHPLHVTVRVKRGLPGLRSQRAYRAIKRAFTQGKDRFGFRLNEYSVQDDHIHMLCEAEDREALSRGLQGLLIRIAKALNRAWKRLGGIFADRYHARILKTPREVRNALRYVMNNALKHGKRLLGIDPCSSGPWFDGWRDREAREQAAGEPPVARARTWLLGVGWRRHGRIGVAEVPGRRSKDHRARRRTRDRL